MTFDPEMLKKLIAIFQGELEESSNVLVNGLVELEKSGMSSEARQTEIELVFRAAHNLKGAARGVGVETIGNIAHHIESIFDKIKLSNQPIPKKTIDVCLEAVDKMQLAMQAFLNKTALTFDLQELLNRMNACLAVGETKIIIKEKNPEVSYKKTTSEILKPEVVKPEPAQIIHESPTQASTLAASDSVRVPLKVIDKLSELSEEIQASKIEMDDHAAHAKKIAHVFQDFSDTWQDMSEILNDVIIRENDHRLQKSFSRVNDELVEMTSSIQKISQDLGSQSGDYARLARSIQDEVSLLRLVPANNYLSMLPRYTRELATELHKQVDLEIRGNNVYIDKYVLESLKDPINHLLRNAIDHGLETPAERLEAGKSEMGKIIINVKDAGHKVIFEISDDGAGLNYQNIKNKVIKLHPDLAEKIESLSQHQIEDYIFHPGFSTASVVSSISGRGVGLDVVRKNVQALKGSIAVENKPGKGITFRISVPLSISSERGLLVLCDEQIYVLPTSSVIRVMSINQNDVINLEGSYAVLVNGHPVILKSLATALGGVERSGNKQNFPVVILKSQETLIALLLDEVLGEREIVIKPIHEPLSMIDCVSGATLLDRNKIAIVLDPDQLFNISYHSSDSYLASESIVTGSHVESIRILVVDDSITTRTLEKNILESKNYLVTTAVNGQEAWEILQNQSFDLVITDISMPIMDGFELTEKIKTSDKFANLPVIIVTSLGSDAEKARGIDVGADAYIVKNEFESGILLQMINRLI